MTWQKYEHIFSMGFKASSEISVIHLTLTDILTVLKNIQSKLKFKIQQKYKHTHLYYQKFGKQCVL